MDSHNPLNKAVAIGIFLIFLASCIIPAMASHQNLSPLPLSRGTWFYVGGTGPGNYTKIQSAVENATDGDTVFVYSGIYNEFVIFHHAITLLGEDKNTTVLSGYFAFTVYILADGTTMSGFTIYTNGRGEGIRIDSNDNTFSDNIIDAPRDRIRIAGNNNIVADNTIRNCYLYIEGDNNTITGNSVLNYQYGIYLTDCADTLIVNNTLSHCGLFIADDTVHGTIVTGNTVNDKSLVYFDKEADQTIEQPAGQILLVNCTNITIRNQDIVNTTVAIQLHKSTTCTITDTLIANNYYGLCLHGTNNTATHNTMRHNYYGIYLAGDRNTILENSLVNNTADGIYLTYSSHNIIRKNSFTRNPYGILLNFGSEYNTLTENTIQNNSHAIAGLSGSFTTVINENTITDNDEGIYLSHTEHNSILKNTIADNNKSILVGAGCTSTSIRQNTILNNQQPFYVYSNDGTIIADNIVTGNHNGGIELISSDDNNLTNNTITGNKGNGIVLIENSHAHITANTITNNTFDGLLILADDNIISSNIITTNGMNGITLANHKNTTITGNTLASNHESGIYLIDSTDNSIQRNKILHHGKGIFLVSSMNNSILDNTFQKNTWQAYFENCTNYWDHNYWGHPRLLPKLIFGITNGSLHLDVDRHPALRPQS